MTKLNMSNRTLGIMDNLRFLRSLNNDCVDLIAIDPPFAANETFTDKPKIPISDAELAAEKALAREHGAQHDEGRDTRVRDIWTWDDNVHPDWLSRMEDDYPPVFSVIKAVETCASENEAAYIAFMAVRLVECRRVLKPTGSIYIHCDSHANAYLRLLMDAVFGAKNFRNEIVWKRITAGKSSQHRDARFGANTDTILFYAMDRSSSFTPYRKLTEKEESKKFNLVDENGERYYDDSSHIFRPMGLGPRPNLCFTWREFTNPNPSGWTMKRERLEEEYQKGNFVILPSGKLQRRKYLRDYRGLKLPNLWDDMTNVLGDERTGYATQKPLALYERIIAASSNPDDVVLDIFAGCATTAVAAERLGRQWIACDMAYRSWTMLKRRFRLNNIALSDPEGMRATDEALRLGLVQDSEVEWGKRAAVLGPDDLPARDDADPEPFHSLRSIARGARRGRKSARSASWSGRIPKDEAKQLLIDEFGAECWGCGWEAPTFPSGERDLALLEIDHIWARNDAATASANEGGSDELYNLALLHSTCNRTKSNRMTLEQLRRQNADDQRLYKGLGNLVHLGKAQQFAMEKILMRGVQTAAGMSP